MNVKQLIALALALLSVSACIVTPLDGRGPYGGGGYDYGRRVWHE